MSAPRPTIGRSTVMSQRETMASSSHRNWPLTTRYATRATKARFPTTRPVDPCRRPPPKKGPFPAPATPRRRLPTILHAKAPPLSGSSRRKNGGFAMEKAPSGNLGDIFLALGWRRAYEQQQSGDGVRAVCWSVPMEGKAEDWSRLSKKSLGSSHLQFL